MSEQSINYSSWFKPWWKALLVLAFFPFTLSYFIWLQKWKTPAKLGAIALLWIIVIGIGSDGSNKASTATNPGTQVEAKPSPTPEPEITLEQKQEDFRKFYVEYQSKGQAIVIIQASITQLANTATSREELYLSLEKMSAIQSNLASPDLEVPASLKGNKQLNAGISNLRLAATYYQRSIDEFKKYLDNDDLKALSEAKSKTDIGTAKLTESADAIDAVARELGLDPEQLKKEN